MSSASVVISNREKTTSELSQELDSLRAMNNSLRSYLTHLRNFKRNLASMNNNCKTLYKVNTEWVDTLTRK